ncbi:MAG: CBS domain-containing protein [Myxococcota bacterium]|nr:CBS domain-containing protein [Myxococcota bacterium]
MARTKTTPRTAAQIMNRRIEAVAPEAPIPATVQTLMRRGYSGAPVVDAQGQLVGVLSEREGIAVLADAVYEGWPAGHVADHMSRQVEVVAPDDDVFTVASRFTKGGHRRIFVVDQGRLVGLITRRDLLRVLDEMRAETERGERSDTYKLIQIRHQKFD